MKLNLTGIMGIVILVLMFVIFLQHGCSRDTEQREIEIPITIPEHKGIISTPVNHVPNQVYIYVPKTTVKADTSLLNKYKKANDSLKELLYKDAVSTRTYLETFEDDKVVIDIESNVQGKQLGLSIPSYKIKEQKSSVTYLPPRELDLYVGAELGIPTLPNTSFILKANLEIDSGNLRYKVGYDTERRVWGGLSLKLL